MKIAEDSSDFHLAVLDVLNQLDKPQQAVEAWHCWGFSSVNPSWEAPGEAKLLSTVDTACRFCQCNKRTDSWPLVYSPVPISCIFLCYLVIIWLGPKLMAKRQPVNLKPVLIVYNFTMVCLSAYMFYEFTASSWLAQYSLLCQPVDYSDSPLAMRMARVCWWFYFSKVIELSDTIFFILRKKNNQLTFLHVYHHATMIFNWWAGVKYVAGGQSFLIGLINSLVHIVMYLYYGLAAFGPSMSKYLWWKRYLTSLQLLQFFIVTIHTTYNLSAHCDFPDSMNMVVLAYSLSLIALFSNFYYHSYLAKKKSKKT